MKNRLPGTLAAVHLHAVSRWAIFLIQKAFHLFCDGGKADGFLRRDLKIGSKMSFRNHEAVPFAHGEFVRDHVEVFIFQDVVFGFYFAKNAIHIYPPQD